jgi:tyrosinase
MLAKHISRRSFLGTVGAAAVGATMAHGTAAAAHRPCRFRIGGCATWIRQNIASLSPSQLASLAHGVEVMKSRPAADPTSWRFQANIHGTDDPPQPLFNQCEHFNIQFLTWHRAYIYFFERILREASGNPFLALPYWDWSTSRALPLPFRQPPVAANPLYDATRNINDGSEIPESFVVDDLNTALGYVEFDSGFPAFSPSFEDSPHGQVHVQIGGNMSTFEDAGNDPIFWLHHCNIDRVWDRWLNLNAGRANPADAGFLDQEYSFADETGDTVTIRVRDILDSYCLQYRYDDTPNPGPAVAAQSAFAAAAPPAAAERPSRVVGSSLKESQELALPQETEPVPLKFERHSAKLFLAADSADALKLLPEAATAGRRTASAVLAIEGITFAEVPSFSYAVYLNLPDGNLTADEKRRHYVGGVNFFGHGHKERHADGTVHPAHGPVTFTQSLDATAILITLRKAGEWTDEPTVTLEPVTPVPPNGAEEEHAARARRSAERAQISYKRVLLTIAPRSDAAPLR